MSVLDLELTMNALKAKIVAGGQKRVHANPGEAVTAPAIVVGYPTEITFDVTFGRGADQFTFPIFAIAGTAKGTATRKQLSAYVRGAVDLKDALDGPMTVSGTVVTCRVTEAKVQPVTIDAVEYLALVFDTEVIG